MGFDTHMKQTTLLGFLHVIAVNYKHFFKKNWYIIKFDKHR